MLCNYHWPGNVRELRATIKRLTLRAAGGAITTAHVRREIEMKYEITAEAAPPDVHSPNCRDAITYTGELRKGESFDSHFYRQKLTIYEDLVRFTGGHSKAAEWLGLDPKALHHRIRRLRRQLARRF
jgi:DNA-binding NtrC family response regulator